MTTDSLVWPPPTVNMTAAQLIELRTVATNLLEHLEQEIPARCGGEGHVWTEPRRGDIVVNEGYYVEPNPDVFLSHGYYRGRVTEPGFRRTCKRCGKEETKRAVTTITSPW